MSTTCQNCDLEGGSVVIVSQPQQAYCEQCGNDSNTCIDKLDTKCVYYHYNHPELPTTLINLGIPSNTDLQTILEKINDLIGQNSNIDLTAIDSETVNLTATGAAKHTLRADIIPSAEAGNILQVRSSGVFVPNTSDGKVKVNATDASDYLKNQVIGGSDGVIAINVTDVSGLLTISPYINIGALVTELSQNSSFTNIVSIGQTPITANDSATIDFTASGTLSHTLTGSVKLSATAGNQLTANSDGLYVATASAITASNALNKNVNDIQLGGPLTTHTTVSGTGFDLLWTPRTYNIGNNVAGHFGLTGVDMSGTKFVVSNTYATLPSVGVTQKVNSAAVSIGSGASLISGRVVTSAYNSLTLNSTVNWNVGFGNPITGSLSLVTLNPTTATTVTMSQGTGVRPVSAAAAITILQPSLSATTGTVTHAAGFTVYAPQQENTAGTFYPKITNYYGVVVQDSREFLIIDNTVITNSYGIYQYGALDKNEFFGELRYHNGLTNASDGRVKNELSAYSTGLAAIKQVRPIVYKYREDYQPVSETFVGVIAQEVEGILPYAIRQGINKNYTDFRYYDDKPLIYALVNAVKELSARIEVLEAQ